MQDNPNANAAPHREHIEVDADFFNRLADRFTAKQAAQQQAAQQQEVGNATKTLAGVLATFYKELRRGGIPRTLAFKLVNDMLLVLLKR